MTLRTVPRVGLCDARLRIVSYTDGLNRQQFVADSRTYDATLRNLDLIGEAAVHEPRGMAQRSGHDCSEANRLSAA